MPFTPAHAAAALPLLRLRWLAASAFVIGTQVPDLPMFFPRLTPTYVTTHSATWTLPSNLPYALALLYAFEWSRPALVAVLPARLRLRLAGHAAPRFPRGVVAFRNTVASIALGILTHVVWDEFTHVNRFGMVLFPSLGRPWVHDIPGYRLLQFVSGGVGLLLIAGFALRWLRRQRVGPDLRRRFHEPARRLTLTLTVLVPVACVVLAYLRHPPAALTREALQPLAYDAVTTAIAAELIAALAIALLYRSARCTYTGDSVR